MKKILSLIAFLALTGCATPLAQRSFYDASDPQPKAFYDWMDKVSAIASDRDENIDGDEDPFFLSYWRKGYTPMQAIWHWENDPWPNMGGGA